MRGGDIVLIYWHDACATTGGWMELGEVVIDPLPVASVGYLLKRTRTAVTIVQSQNASGFVDHPLCIPRKWIESIEVLQEA